jgi:hypothetical protein
MTRTVIAAAAGFALAAVLFFSNIHALYAWHWRVFVL